MLLNVVDQCLSLALASATRQVRASRPFAGRAGWHAPLASYPRLREAMMKAEADGLLRARGGRLH